MLLAVDRRWQVYCVLCALILILITDSASPLASGERRKRVGGEHRVGSSRNRFSPPASRHTADLRFLFFFLHILNVRCVVVATAGSDSCMYVELCAAYNKLFLRYNVSVSVFCIVFAS